MTLQEAQTLAQTLFNKHNLSDWNIQFDYAIRRFGYCNYTKKIISLSAELTELNNYKIVNQILLHEIAHAIAPTTAHHGKIWQDIARSIGYTGGRTYGYDVITPPKKYIGTCPFGHTWDYSKKRKISCGKCSPKFNKKYLFKFTINPEYKPNIGIENL